jgi:hypothetical protein
MALSHYTGIPRTLARPIREILPEAVPGKRLAQCSPSEFLHLMMRRHTGRVEHETRNVIQNPPERYFDALS